MATRAYQDIATLLEQHDHPIIHMRPDGTHFTTGRQVKIPAYGVAILRGLEELLRDEDTWPPDTPEGYVA